MGYNLAKPEEMGQQSIAVLDSLKTDDRSFGVFTPYELGLHLAGTVMRTIQEARITPQGKYVPNLYVLLNIMEGKDTKRWNHGHWNNDHGNFLGNAAEEIGRAVIQDLGFTLEEAAELYASHNPPNDKGLHSQDYLGPSQKSREEVAVLALLVAADSRVSPDEKNAALGFAKDFIQ